MANVFDQFDQAAATQHGNVFDQFDQPAKQPGEAITRRDFRQQPDRQLGPGPQAAGATAAESFGAIGRGVARGPLGAMDIPGDVAGMLSDSDKYILGLIDKYVPSASKAAGTISRAVSPSQVTPSAGHFREKVAPSEKLPVVSGMAELATGVVAPIKLAKSVGAFGKRLTTPKPQPTAAQRIAGEIEASAMDPSSIRASLSLDDLSKVPGFEKRYPKMSQYGVRNADDAAKTAGEMYDQVEGMKRGLDASLDVMAVNPKLKSSYAKAINDALEITPPGILSPGIVKLMKVGKGPFTVGDKLKAMRQLRRMERMTTDVEKKRYYREYVNMLKDLKTRKGFDDSAHSMLREADELYTEAMRVGEVGESLVSASKKGKVYGEGLVRGVPKVKAIDVLKEFDEIGDQKMFNLLGENYSSVKSALQQIGESELTTQNFGQIASAVGGVGKLRALVTSVPGFKVLAGFFGDWRVLSKVAPGQVVGTPAYHAAKAVKGMVK